LVGGESIGEVVRNAAATRPAEPFFLFESESYTPQQVDELSDRVATALAAMGVARGDHVALMMANRPDWVWTWLAIAKLGAVLVPVNTSLKGEGLSYIVDHSDAVLAVVGKESAEAFRSVRKRLGKIRAVVAEGDESWGEAAFAELLHAKADPPQVKVEPDDNLEIIYTSGTTGLPKGRCTACCPCTTPPRSSFASRRR
jgi:crotonobetaine/carnitine-CoA ligase